MEWLEHQRRQQVEKRREAREASDAIDVLLGLGWTSENFADIAAGLKKQAAGAQPLRKIITKSK
jgi:hypothetical protein